MSTIPQITVDGRKITVTFELPFAEGDTCITPYQAARTTVNRIPDIRIDLQDNLKRVSLSNYGAWYTSNHSQQHGPADYLPDMDAFLAHWLGRGGEDAFADRYTWLRRLFADNPDALAALHRRLIQAKADELQEATRAMTTQAREHTKTVAALESELQKLKDTTP